MNFADWKYYTNQMDEIIGVISPDGTQSCSLQDQAYLAWLESGGIPLPAENT